MHRQLLSGANPAPGSLVAGRQHSLQQAHPRQQALVQQTRPSEACKHKAAPCSAFKDTVEAAPQAWDGLADERAALHVGARQSLRPLFSTRRRINCVLEHVVWCFVARCKKVVVACSIVWSTGTLAILPRQRGSCESS